MSELLQRIEEGLDSGLMPDLPQTKPRLWEDGANIIFADAGVEPLPGQSLLISSPNGQMIRGLLETTISGVPTVIFGTATTLYLWTQAGGVSAVGTGYSASTKHWSLVKWGEWLLASNNIDAPQIYKGTSFAALTGTPPSTAKLLVRHPAAPFVLAFATDLGNEYIEWCDIDDVEDWVSTTSNWAGRLPVRDLDSGIRAAVPFRNEIAFFSKNTIGTTRFLGAGNVFGAAKLLEGGGAVGPMAVAVAGGMLYGWGPRGIWVSDGSSVKYLDNPLIRERVYENFDRDHEECVVAWHDRTNSMIVFFYPSIGAAYNDLAVGFNYTNGSWTVLNMNRSAASDSGVFDFGLTGDRLGNIYFQGIGQFPGISSGLGELVLEEEKEGRFGVGQFGVGEQGFGGYLLWR